MAFTYDRSIQTPEKHNQSQLSKLAGIIDRRLTQKVLDFLNRI